jgi:hypothetical protein
MGRPNQCNPCCGSVGSTSEPRISDCEKVICVAVMARHYSDASYPGSAFSEKMNLWRLAYPERLLFVLDVLAYLDTTVASTFYTENFISWPKAFSLRLEYEKGYGGLIEYIERDSGSTAIANFNNPWQRIKTIVNHYGGDVLQIFNDSREVSVFADNSGFMTAGQVAATVEKLKQDAMSDDKVIVSSISNSYELDPRRGPEEDVICPFIQTSCNTGQASQTLMSRCGLG